MQTCLERSTDYKNYDLVMDYAESILSGKKVACKELIQACVRFKRDLENPQWDFRPRLAEVVIQIIERTFCHAQGQKLDSTPLRGTPFLLEPFHKFIVYNLLGFYLKGTNIRRFKEAFIYIPRKNIKTSFAAGLAWALSMVERMSGSKCYIVGAALKQALESFNLICYNIKRMGEEDSFRIIDNNQEHSISGEIAGGSIFIQALAANPDAQDSLNCNLAIADEIHAYKSPKQYNIIKEAMKAYTNKLMIGITTAGDKMASFCYRRLQYCKSVLSGTVTDDQYFIFICKADEGEKGEVDFTNPRIHEMANPAYGISIRPEDIMNDAMQALNDPQQRKDFLAKSLNVYTSAVRAYFDIEKFRQSDRRYNWTLAEILKKPIKWYGGADLSKMHDLTASALYGTYPKAYKDESGQWHDVDIIIPHCWFPIVAAHQKAEEDAIPLFGWQDDGWLDMSNDKVVNHAEIINWFISMRAKGFRIKQVGHDRKFCREYFIGMKQAKFQIVDQPQYFYKKSEGFRHIEKKMLAGDLYYFHADPFEYCVENIYAIEKTDDMIQYDKIEKENRIDVFDAAVFACIRMLEDMERSGKASQWFGEE